VRLAIAGILLLAAFLALELAVLPR